MRSPFSAALAAALAGGLTATVVSAVPPATAGVRQAEAAAPAVVVTADRRRLATTDNACLRSRPEPGRDHRVKICYTIFKPRNASRSNKVPFIMHSHGWGSSRSTRPRAFGRWLRSGYGVLSFDQRGFGESGGKAHVEKPAYEGRDNLRLIRRVARLPWVRKDGPGDPRMGAIGGSYGGGYQYLGAFMEIRRNGKPIYDALAPEITWNNLNESLAPQGVVRTEWALALRSAAQPSNALPKKIDKALAEGVATGDYPDGSGPSGVDLRRFFRRNGPSWHVDRGRRLDIPVLMGQGHTDTLFNLRQGLRNFRTALTRDARRRSMFVGYNGGHVLPAIFPRGTGVSGDPCSRRLVGGGFARLAKRFMDEKLRGRDRDLSGYGRVHLATRTNTCTTVRSPAATTTREAGQVIVNTGPAGAPVAVRLARGPIKIAGNASFRGRLTAVGVRDRAFYGLGVGSSQADAELIQNNVYPVNVRQNLNGVRRRVELPSVAANIPRGENLYLIASPTSETFAGTGSRTPGLITFDNTVVNLPVRHR